MGIQRRPAARSDAKRAGERLMTRTYSRGNVIVAAATAAITTTAVVLATSTAGPSGTATERNLSPAANYAALRGSANLSAGETRVVDRRVAQVRKNPRAPRIEATTARVVYRDQVGAAVSVIAGDDVVCLVGTGRLGFMSCQNAAEGIQNHAPLALSVPSGTSHEVFILLPDGSENVRAQFEGEESAPSFADNLARFEASGTAGVVVFSWTDRDGVARTQPVPLGG